jgi:hypothetical protein
MHSYNKKNQRTAEKLCRDLSQLFFLKLIIEKNYHHQAENQILMKQRGLGSYLLDRSYLHLSHPIFLFL